VLLFGTRRHTLQHFGDSHPDGHKRLFGLRIGHSILAEDFIELCVTQQGRIVSIEFDFRARVRMQIDFGIFKGSEHTAMGRCARWGRSVIGGVAGTFDGTMGPCARWGRSVIGGVAGTFDGTIIEADSGQPLTWFGVTVTIENSDLCFVNGAEGDIESAATQIADEQVAMEWPFALLNTFALLVQPGEIGRRADGLTLQTIDRQF
jgi:hypothetical protein